MLLFTLMLACLTSAKYRERIDNVGTSQHLYVSRIALAVAEKISAGF